MSHPVDVTIIGGGMITNDLILPSVFHLQRQGVVGDISVCALNSGPLYELKKNREIQNAFPGQDFTAFPETTEAKEKMYPDLYKQVLQDMPPRQAVIIATPDQFHYAMVMQALEANQHVLCVKPLVLKYEQSREIERLAYEKGLFVGIEYHKRFDRRSLLAKKSYADGDFGEFRMGEAKMIEPFYYRFSNFQNWFTAEQTDPFVYVGCHYVDLVYFITGLKPTEVSVQGVIDVFPNGAKGYMWANGRVRFENGALLTVTDGLGYPDDGAGSNEQCLTMFCEKDNKAGLIKHNDQFRGVSHSFVNQKSAGKMFHYINPDFYRLVPWEGEGLKPVGYGFDSIAATINSIHRIENETRDFTNEEDALFERRKLAKATERKGIIAMPGNSYINELVVEAARRSILGDGVPVEILYGENPHIELKKQIEK